MIKVFFFPLVGIIFMFYLVVRKKESYLWLYFYNQIEDFVIDDVFCDDWYMHDFEFIWLYYWYMHDFGFIWLYYCVLYLLLILMLFKIHYVERISYCFLMELVSLLTSVTLCGSIIHDIKSHLLRWQSIFTQ